MMSSVSPSARRPVASSPPRLSNGSTAMDGDALAGSAGQNHQIPPRETAMNKPAAATRTRRCVRLAQAAGGATRAAPSSTARNVSTGSLMFLTRCRPVAAKARSSLPLTWLWTPRDTQTPPGSHKPSIRAATLMPSPNMVSPSTMTSPRLMPTR